MTEARHLRLALVVVLVAAAAGAALLVVYGGGGGAKRKVLVHATVNPRSGTTIPQHFLGLSVEYPDIIPATGGRALSAGIDRMFVRLIRNVGDAGNGPPTLRIGGGSADQAWWNPNGQPKPPGVTIDITPTFALALSDFQQLTGMPLILTLNMASNDPGIATAWASAAQATLPSGSISAFEVGNEPYYYTNRPFGAGPARPPNWGYPQYAMELSRFIAALETSTPKPPLAAPVPCCHAGWDNKLKDFLGRFGHNLDLLTYHIYPFCTKRPPPLSDLLSKATIARTIAFLRPLVEEAKRHGLPLRVTETDPSACGADNRFGSALWALDWMYAAARTGAAGLDFHQIGPSPFRIFGRQGKFLGSVAPIYYAMLMFSESAPEGAGLVPVAVRESRVAPDTKVWATIDPHGTVRVVVIQKGTGSDGDVAVRISGANSTATLTRLSAPALTATRGVTLGGQAVADPTTSGRLIGARRAEMVKPGAGGTYRFPLDAAGASMLTIPHASR